MEQDNGCDMTADVIASNLLPHQQNQLQKMVIANRKSSVVQVS